MKKLLLTLLLLFTLGLAAQAVDVTFDFKPSALSGLPSSSNNAPSTATDYTFNGYTLTMLKTFRQKSKEVGYIAFVKNASDSYIEISGFNETYTLTKIALTNSPNGTAASTFIVYIDNVKAGNISAANGSLDIPATVQKANAKIKIEPTDRSKQYSFSTAVLTFAENLTKEKVTLDEANLVVKTGEETIESEKELDANAKVTFSYNTDNTNADITYSYSVDGGEDIEGNEYTYTGEKDVVLTVKATSENTVSKTVKLLKKYPTVCPEPIFSVEDGAKVYAGQGVTVSCEGAEIEWTVNGTPITGTSYTITEAVGTQLTFYALASIEGRNPSTGNIETLMAEKEITVTVEEATEATFNFNEKNYGLTRFTAGSDYEPTLTEISEGIVKINFTGNFRLWGASAGDQLRVMSGATFTISVPEGYYIESINFNGNSSAASSDYGTLSNGNWENNGTQKSAVKFSRGSDGKVELNSITVKYAMLPPTLDGDAAIIVKHGTSAGVLTVKYSFSVANYVAEKHNVKVDIIVDGHDLTFEEVKHEASAAPARANANSTVFTKEKKATHESLKGIATPAVTVRATLNGTELFSKAAEAKDITTTGIEDVTVEVEGEAEYYNMQGLRVAQPEAGQLYIKRQGGKAVKVRF